MGEQKERSGFCKLLCVILILYTIILFNMGITFKAIPEYREAIAGIFVDPIHILIWTFGYTIILWFRPRDEHTRVYLLVLVLYFIFNSILVFLGEFVWVITEIRILHSLFYITPVFPLLLYVVITEFVERDYTIAEYDILIKNDILKYPTVEEGLDYVLDYIDDPQWEYEDGYKDAFLEYMSERDDELGQLARDKLHKEF